MRDLAGLDYVFGWHEPLRHRRLAYQERAGHLIDAQAAQESQGQGHVVLRSQRRMAASEDQPKLVVTHGSVLCPVLSARAGRCACDRTKLSVELPAPGRTAKIIDRTISCGRNDPPCRVGWDAVAPPPVACHNERLLNGVFGKRDVAEDTDQRRHRLAVHLTEYALNTGRLSMGGDGTGHALRHPASRRMGGLRS